MNSSKGRGSLIQRVLILVYNVVRSTTSLVSLVVSLSIESITSIASAILRTVDLI